MPSDDVPVSARSETDESLRAERERSDDALGEKLAEVEATADGVLSRARARADEVLAAARARSDARLARAAPGSEVTTTVAQERRAEDHAVDHERSVADETLRLERAAHVALLASERQETDRDLSSERALADDALATRDELLGIVSHDLRNMLHAIVGFAGLIDEEASRDAGLAAVRTYAQRIRRAGGRMDRLVGDLVDLASIHAGVLAVTPEPSDPGLVVAEVVEAFQAQATARDLRLTIEVPAAVPAVSLDAARILQVLTNLLGNALKFTPPGGAIVTRLERVGADVRFSVTDTGCGIPADKLDAIFERYLQGSPHDRRGVGLGLYICRCIVQGHGGRIAAESEVGRGSTFAFTLPIDGPRPRDEAASPGG